MTDESPCPHSLTLGSALTPAALTLAATPLDIEFTEAASAAMKQGSAFVKTVLDEGRPVYGATTGFGALVGFDGRESAADQCDNVLGHLTVGQGPELAPDVARAVMLARLWSLSRGLSGVSDAVVHALAAMLATGFAPAIPSLGSVGASGDLIPLAHAVQSLRGVGHAYVDGVRMPATEALAVVGLDPLRLDGRDALALVNGISVTSAVAGLAAHSAARSVRTAVALVALLADLLGCAPAFLAPPLLAAFGHPEVEAVGAHLSRRLTGLVPVEGRPLQEPYSIRCTPQLLGAADSALSWAAEVVTRDLNGVSDNPLFFAEEDLVAHGGNFFGQPSAFAADTISSALTQMGNLAERQIDLLVDPHRNGGRPPMLSTDPGKHHAIQGLQVLATATVVSMRRNCVPAAMQSVPTNMHNQDVVPFGTQAALTAFEQSRSLRLLHGCLGVALVQAAHTGTRKPTAPANVALLDALVDRVAPIEQDRILDADIRAAADVLDGLFDREQAI
ncbi:HAL/PAL/TAL family ammonia-lyase [Nocardia higoensis]|uniref:HAL/PAL/TAL family ammonia-lyase n=1 Tax=Nocardia higoensis TaxID=228599 RepID=UPI001461550E|nr:aromatic amino acid ammonia-lyase [Nocardia higoensis]